jgi:hypothetical protein
MNPALAAVANRVPHYDGGAVVTGSLVFLALMGVVAVLAFHKRRR